jgi:hypothetical protein
MQQKNQTSRVEGKERTDSTDPRREDGKSPESSAENVENTAEEDDESPVLDEQDLEENNLSDEEADKVEWEPGDKKAQQGE